MAPDALFQILYYDQVLFCYSSLTSVNFRKTRVWTLRSQKRSYRVKALPAPTASVGGDALLSSPSRQPHPPLPQSTRHHQGPFSIFHKSCQTIAAKKFHDLFPCQSSRRECFHLFWPRLQHHNRRDHNIRPGNNRRLDCFQYKLTSRKRMLRRPT